ncbi:MAG: NTP transferase domain-containing protein [Planctomycetes bacterium]|nr:NTP transferase domain-containing protein [Planctomycetota bacterium]
MKVSVIVAAAGSARRFGGKRNKIFEKVDGRPMFLRTLELFVNRDDVCQTLLVISPDDEAEMKERFGGNLGFMGVRIVLGGPQRTDSIRNALACVDDQADLVAVHDAARPCVSPLWIDAVFAEAERTGAAILACPVHGTLKKVRTTTREPDGPIPMLGGEPLPGTAIRRPKDHQIVQTVSRDELWEAQTPQVFSKKILMDAYAKAADAATDDAALVEAMGRTVHVVMGDPRNVKITVPGDLAVASALIQTLPKPKPKRDAHPFSEAQW